MPEQERGSSRGGFQTVSVFVSEIRCVSCRVVLPHCSCEQTLFPDSAGISAAAAASGGAGHDSDEDDDEDEDDEESLPVYAMRVSIAKLMLEVGQPVPAALILERLLLEDDTVPEVWFLIAAAYRDSSRLATARQYLTTLEEVSFTLVSWVDGWHLLKTIPPPSLSEHVQSY